LKLQDTIKEKIILFLMKAYIITFMIKQYYY
jgi:hypothetical protein